MNNQEFEKLLGGYATGNLTPEQREQVLRAAFHDQNLFDDLAEEEAMRTVLEQPEFRQQLRRRLQELRGQREQTAVAKVARWWRSPWALGLAAAAAAMVMTVVLVERRGGGPETNLPVALGDSSLPTVSPAGLQEEPLPAEKSLREEIRSVPPQSNIPAAIGLDRAGKRPTYKIGDALRLGFTVKRDANVLVVEELPDGTTLRLFPNRFISSARVAPDDKVLIPPSGQGDMTVEGPPGERKVRLLVFPPNVDPLADGGVNWKGLQGKITVIEKEYQVVNDR